MYYGCSAGSDLQLNRFCVMISQGLAVATAWRARSGHRGCASALGPSPGAQNGGFEMGNAQHPVLSFGVHSAMLNQSPVPADWACAVPHNCPLQKVCSAFPAGKKGPTTTRKGLWENAKFTLSTCGVQQRRSNVPEPKHPPGCCPLPVINAICL